jgi:hypothetical protein
MMLTFFHGEALAASGLEFSLLSGISWLRAIDASRPLFERGPFPGHPRLVLLLKYDGPVMTRGKVVFT